MQKTAEQPDISERTRELLYWLLNERAGTELYQWIYNWTWGQVLQEPKNPSNQFLMEEYRIREELEMAVAEDGKTAVMQSVDTFFQHHPGIDVRVCQLN